MKHNRCAFTAIGTAWSIEAETTGSVWDMVMKRTLDKIESFDQTFSRFRPDSLVTKMSQKTGTYAMPEDGFEMLQFYELLYELTNGFVTPLIGNLMSDAGYDATYSFKPGELTQPPSWQDTIRYTKTELTLFRPALLDFGAAGKGYLVDVIAELFHEAGVPSFTINAGGDLHHFDASQAEVEVGLENPFDSTQAIGIARLGGASLCASAGSRRKWDGYHHLMHPVSLKPVTDVAATWVISDRTMQADGLATALFFCEAAQLKDHYVFSYCLLHDDMSVQFSDNFPGTFFEAAA